MAHNARRRQTKSAQGSSAKARQLAEKVEQLTPDDHRNLLILLRTGKWSLNGDEATRVAILRGKLIQIVQSYEEDQSSGEDAPSTD